MPEDYANITHDVYADIRTTVLLYMVSYVQTKVKKDRIMYVRH